MATARRTVGVEEEFLLLSSDLPTLAGAGDAVVDEANRIDRDAQFEHELKQSQAELASSPTDELRDLGDDLRVLRAELATASERRGVRLVASATSPVTGQARTTDSDRYRRMTEQFGVVARDQLSCGMHIHVSVESTEEGVDVIDRLRPWLAVFCALSSNSPFYRGEDTGYSSYRSILWGQWPSAGSTEAFGDRATYERVQRDVIAVGAARDEAMIYFDARLSTRYPTVEIRICDVCPRHEDSVTLAGLARALVDTVACNGQDGAPAPIVRAELLRAAAWRAARWGMTGELVDLVGAPASPALIPAWDLVDEVLDRTGPALEANGDADTVRCGLAEIRARGTGAELQRAAFDAASDFATVIEAVRVTSERRSW